MGGGRQGPARSGGGAPNIRGCGNMTYCIFRVYYIGFLDIPGVYSDLVSGQLGSHSNVFVKHD